MARPIFIIRSHICHDHDGPRVDTPGAMFRPTAATAHTHHNSTTLTQSAWFIKSVTRKLNIQRSGDYSLTRDSPKVSREGWESLPWP